MPLEEEPGPAADTNTTTTTTPVVNGKRKRSASEEEGESVQRPTNQGSEEEKAQRKKDVIQAVAKDLLVVLKEYDPAPSILSYSLSSIASMETQSPPTKRTKLSSPVPDTILGRLSEATYASFNGFLSDVSAVCRMVMNELNSPKSGAEASNCSTSWENVNTTVARVIHFERLAKDLVHRQRKRLVNWLDFTEELDATGQQPLLKASDKVALTVLTYGGPVFSSLPMADNITIPSAVTSRATSTSGSPKSPASTAATSVGSEWPKHHKAESVTVTAPFFEPAIPLPHISTVKAIPVSKYEDSVVPKAPKLGEMFPPPQALDNLPQPQNDYTRVGLKWGGEVGPGGIVVHPELEYKSEVTGHWLQYTNYPRPGFSRLPPDPFRQGIGLPSNFVAAYSSFAPSSDESSAKVPSAVRNGLWWERRGGRIFRRMFGRDSYPWNADKLWNPEVGNMFSQYDSKKQSQPQPSPAPPKPTSIDVDESEIEKLIESFEDLPIDTRLLMSHDATLSEISTLLSTLQNQQYTRLASSHKPTSPHPVSAEHTTYTALKARLTALIDALPPHLLATIDGHPDSTLILSHKIPILAPSTPVFRGTLPADDKPPQQVQSAAMSAINAAAGLSPISPAPAPVAPMPHISTPRHPPHMPIGAPPPQPPQTPQAYSQTPQAYPQTPQAYPQTPQAYPQTPQVYPQRPQPQPQPQHQTPVQNHIYQRPRGSVPPPQGLGAIGVGGGYYPQQQQPQASPAAPSPMGAGRYSQRVRR